MAAQIDNALGSAALNATERHAVADPNETHHDRRSDIDMMAIVGPGRERMLDGSSGEHE